MPTVTRGVGAWEIACRKYTLATAFAGSRSVNVASAIVIRSYRGAQRLVRYERTIALDGTGLEVAFAAQVAIAAA